MKPLHYAENHAALQQASAPAVADDWEAVRLRMHICYLWRHKRLGDFDNPVRFTEWVQWRKINTRDPRLPPLIDKVQVKQHVAGLLGEHWVTPTLWHGTDLPERPEWPMPFVVKARHGCRQYEFVRTGREDWGAIRRKAQKWIREPYGKLLDEWAYAHVPRGVIVEPFIGEGGMLPVDYKVHVFGGKAVCIQVDQAREHGHQRAYFDRNWTRLWASSGWSDIQPPRSLGEIWEASEVLARDFDFARCDFYEIGGKPRFGEITFYPASGLKPLGDALDFWLGGLWADAVRGSN